MLSRFLSQRTARAKKRKGRRQQQRNRLGLEALEQRQLLTVIGDFVWHDLDADGIQDSGEAGVEGVFVHLQGGGADGVLGSGDDTFAMTMTDVSGRYEFNIRDNLDTIMETDGFIIPKNVVDEIRPVMEKLAGK